MADVDGTQGFTSDTVAFFTELEQHNDAAWFDAHRGTYKSCVQAPLAALLEELTARLSDAPVPLRGSRATMFRINRDVRFSKDKRPYNTTASALLTPSGTKAEDAGLLYLQIGSEGGFMAAGLHSPAPARLAPLRDRIVEAPEDFEQVVEDLGAADLALGTDAQLKTMPRGYAEHAEHPQAWALRLKTFIVQRPITAELLLSDDLAERVEEFARDAAPLLMFVAGRGDA
ncbi:DUF2461 domain-containing protein [Jannaschia sp. R86511]|uniref:DUF2461 domain-containing protein n=1 Tax=Jannaschia sp. R86511 TaxID=3093853 RepID=UPI0036D36EB7